MPSKLIPGEKKTPVYKKSSTFKMRSGNTTPFKQMGSSPVKDIKDASSYGGDTHPSTIALGKRHNKKHEDGWPEDHAGEFDPKASDYDPITYESVGPYSGPEKTKK